MTDWQEMFLQDQQNATAIAEPEPIGFAENIQRGGWGGFFDRATLGVKPMVEAGQLYHATKRFQFDNYPRSDEGWKQRGEDKLRIVDYLTEQAEISERGLTIPAKVGNVVFDMLPFMAEFIATGGIASLGKAGTKKAILKVARKYATNQTAKIAANVGGTLASAGLRTALTPQHIAEKYYQNRLPEMGLQDGRAVIGDTQQTPATALYRAVGDHFIELVSEESGAGISKVFGKMARGIMPKAANKSAAKMVNSLRKAWIKAAPGRDSIAFAKRIGEKAGFHGILEEMGEERLGDVLRATFNIEDFGTDGGNVFDRLVASIPDGEQLLVEALAFSVPAAGRAAIAVGHEVVKEPEKPKDVKEYMLTAEGAVSFAQLNPDAATAIASKDSPSRKDMIPTGISRWNAQERSTFAELLRQLQDGPAHDKQRQIPQQDSFDQPQEEIIEDQQAVDEAYEQPTPADSQDYYYLSPADEVFKQAPQPQSVEFEGLENFDFFTAKLDDKWGVYEAVTGLRISDFYDSKEQAIEKAGTKLKEIDRQNLQEHIDAGVKKNGPSPKYADYKPAQEQQNQPQEIPESYMPQQPDAAKESKLQPPKPQEQAPVASLQEGQRVEYPDSKGGIVKGTVESTTHLDGNEYVTVKADPEYEAVIAGGIPIGRKETLPVGQVTAIKEDQADNIAEPKTEKPTGSSVTDSLSAEKQNRLKELKQRFRDKMSNQLNMGFDPELLSITAEMASLYVEAGARTFGEFAKTVIADVGEQFKPYLKSAYLAARNMPGMEDLRSEMDKADYVDDLNEKQIDEILTVNDREQDDGKLERDRLSGVSGSTVASDGAMAETAGTDVKVADTGAAPDRQMPTGYEDKSSDDKRQPQRRSPGDAGDSTQGYNSTREPSVPADEPGRSTAKPGGDGSSGQVHRESDGRRVKAENHRIGADDMIAPRGAITQLKANLAAIKLLKQLESDDRHATPDEKKTLALYTGWGNLSQAFDEYHGEGMLKDISYRRNENWEKKWGKYYSQLKELLTDEEFSDAAASTLNAHYTERGIIDSMWQMAQHLGFTGGTVLEPGAGVGHFFGLTPEVIAKDSKLIGVELDSVSSRVLSKLYPKAKTFNKGFEEVNLPPNSVDLIISNFPFAQEGPADAEKRYGQSMNLHNYFFARSLDTLRPGGLLIAITTHHTMDSAMQQRKLLASKGELVAAIRLPNTAFKANAGTEVTTDIIILKKPTSEHIAGHSWTRVETIQTADGKEASINEYFTANPDMMLGKPSMSGTMYGGREEFTLEPLEKPLADSLNEAIEKLPQGVMSDQYADVNIESISAAEGQKEHSLVFDNGKLLVVKDGVLVGVSEVTNKLNSAKAKRQAISYIKLRDAYQRHLDMMLNEESSDEKIVTSRKELNRIYDEYIGKHGFFNDRSSEKFQFDPGYYLVASLENIETVENPETGKNEKLVTKAAVFSQRTIEPVREPANADTTADALRISLCYRGKVDTAYMARLVSRDIGDIQKELLEKQIAFDNPATGLWESSEKYLSGNVRDKLRAAKQAVETDKRFDKHVKALESIQPETVGIKDIHFRLGGTWIPQDIVTDFAKEVFSSPAAKVKYIPALDQWVVSSESFRKNAKNTQTFGTERFYGHELLEKTLNMRQIRVMDKVSDGETTRSVFNQKQTVAAQIVVEKLQQEFVAWVRKSDEVGMTLQKEYNESFNFYVPPKFNGQHLELPGSSNVFKLRTYQKNVVWRMLQDRCGMIAHCVGAGKTLAMAATAMEMRRLGLAKKPLIVVQNSTLGQFPAQFRTMYPTANILVATPKDLEAKKRKVFMARIASGDYDAVIMAQSSFDLIPNDPERERQYAEDQKAELKETLFELASEEGEKSPSVKAIQRRLKSLDKKLTRLRDKIQSRLDDVLTFEQLGIDALMIDEAHAYKKPPFNTKLTNVKGIDSSPSQKASNLFLKTRHVQEKTGGKGVMLATGTPVTNTLGEAWHMLNIATPHLLEQFNIETFDRFVAAFAQILPTIEMNAGQRWVQRQVLSKFANGPELSRLIQSGWDVLTRDDLARELDKIGKKLPELKGGKTESMSVPLSPSVKSFNQFLKSVYDRFEKLTGKEKRNYSWVPVVTYNAARAAALDIRLVYPQAKDDPGSKVNTLITKTVGIYERTADTKAAQLIFCDSFNHVNLSKISSFVSGSAVDIDIAEGDEAVVKEDMFLYKDIKRKLIAQGINENEIAVVREYKGTKAREELFERVNAGQVRILIGSTSAMGIGVNVQKRLYAIHHLDTPWLPADLEQRQGRLLRYGNIHESVEELAYGMESTLDAAIYAKIVRKAKFIWQVLSGQVSSREFEDPAGALVISAEEQMASLAGDPRIFEKIELENKLRQMRMEKDAHADAVARSRESKFKSEGEISLLVDETIPARQKRQDKVEQLFDGSWTFDGSQLERKEIAKCIEKTIEDRTSKILDNTKKGIIEPWQPRGLSPATEKNIVLEAKINGLDLKIIFGAYKVAAEGIDGNLSFDWRPEVRTLISLDGTQLYNGDAHTGQGIMAVISNIPKNAQRELETANNRVGYLQKNIAEYETIIDSTYDKDDELAEGEQRLAKINEDIVADTEEDGDQRQHGSLPAPDRQSKRPKAVNPKAKTEDGKKLIKLLQKDKNKGPRTIVEFVNDLIHTKMIVGKSQTSKRHPAHYSGDNHIIRSRSGNWQLNFHEAGHALSNLLSDTESGWQGEMKDELINFAKRPGSMASAQSAEEGFAEAIRQYVTDPKEIPNKLLKRIETVIPTDILDGLKDSRKAYEYFRSKPIIEQMEAIQNDTPPKKALLDSLVDLAYRGLYALLGGSVVMHRLTRSTFRQITGEGRLSAFDLTGIAGLVKSKISKAYKSRLKLARAFRDEVSNTKADITSAYQTMIHLRQEVQRALYGIKKGKEGVRVYATGKGFEELTESHVGLLKEAGFDIPSDDVKHGQWIYLSDKSISRIKHDVGLENWQAFSLYGQYRAALERFHKSQHEYPGMYDGLTPAVLENWVKEQTAKHPDWNGHFKEIQKYMDQLLLVSVLSGEHTAAEAVKIKIAWEDYWPLPRQVEDRHTKHSGGGVDPDSGVRAAFGSSLPFRTLDEAIETRTKMALEAYYTNRLMQSMIAFGESIDSMKDLPFDVRKNASRIMLPLRLDTKLAATLNDSEQGQIIADYLNKQLAQEMGVSEAFLKMSGQAIEADDVMITHPGRKIWRSARPRAIHVASVFNNGKRKYYQITDPLLFDMLTRGNNPSKYFNWMSKLMTSMVAPWRRALTQNIGFALANTLSRDPANAGFMGKDGAKSLIPYFYAGCGLINRLKGNNINADAVSQSELLSKALDHTTKDAHQGIVGSFKEMLKEGVALTDYKELSLADKTAALPGQVMSTLMKPIDIFNWTTGGRWLSQTGEELPREGAYISAAKRGASTEAAQVDYDYITGDFGGKPGNANVASMVKAAGFLNPALRIMWGQMTRVTNPDPAARAFNVGAKVPALMMWGAIGAAINYLIVHAINPDDDEREAILEQMRERPDDNRLAYMAIAGKIRLPFDYGLIGAACSYGWNSTEEWLLDDPITAQKKAKVLLARARDLPGITDIINPYIKTGAELWLNHSFFYDDEIVPAWMEAAYPYNPELQTWPNMPDIYSKIGKGLKVSPIKVRYAVQNILTRQMDDAVKAAEKISGKEPYNESADLPVVGRLIHRKSTGWNSQSVKTLSELDRQYDALKAQLKDMEKQKKRGKDYIQLKRQIAKLHPTHNAMLQIERIWKQIKAESTKPNPNITKIDRLKQQMTRYAKTLLSRSRIKEMM